MTALKLRDVTKAFAAPSGERRVVLDGVSLSVGDGERLAIVGESGAGKTTLLHVAAGIIRPDRGEVVVAATDLGPLSEAERDAFRARHVGYVFQRFHLLPHYSAVENVRLGMAFGDGEDAERAASLLRRLGLGDRLDDRPRSLSIGQQQRVAVARALAASPRLVLADEPTGNLDGKRADDAMELLVEGCAAESAALVVVTHDERVLRRFDRVVRFDELGGTGAAR